MRKRNTADEDIAKKKRGKKVERMEKQRLTP